MALAEERFPPDARRRWACERWLEDVVAPWSVPPALAARWLSPADHHLQTEDVVTLRVTYDPPLALASLEVWVDGRRVYGIDDWLGPLADTA